MRQYIADRLRELRDENLRRIDHFIAEERNSIAIFARAIYRESRAIRTSEKRKRKDLSMFRYLCEKHEILPRSRCSIFVSSR